MHIPARIQLSLSLATLLSLTGAGGTLGQPEERPKDPPASDSVTETAEDTASPAEEAEVDPADAPPSLDELDDLSLDELEAQTLDALGDTSPEELEAESLDAPPFDESLDESATSDADIKSSPGGTAKAGSKTDWILSLEGGSEYDSNLHRVEVLEGEVGGVDSGALMRSAARLQLAHRLGAGKLFTLTTVGSTKLFTVPEGQSENLGILYANGRYQQRWGKSRAFIGARGNYYEAFDIRPFGEGVDPVVGRSFRTTEGELSVTLPSEDEDRISLVAGLRDFVYKPDADFNWRGEQLGLLYATMFWLGDPDKESAASIDLRAEYRIGSRSYEGAAFRNTCANDEMVVPNCFVPIGDRRSDLNHLLVGEATYTGAHQFSALYAAEIADSNSYGQASVRHRFQLAVTTEAPKKIFVTAKAVVRFNRFTDPLLLARNVQSQTFVSIDEENRNSLSLDLARDLGKHWGLEARIALFSNEFATEVVRFRRQTAYLGALYRFGSASPNP